MIDSPYTFILYYVKNQHMSYYVMLCHDNCKLSPTAVQQGLDIQLKQLKSPFISRNSTSKALV